MKKEKKKSRLLLKIQQFKEERAQNDVDHMSEEERAQHEQYIKELTAQNKKTVKKVCTVLWCLAMVGWTIFFVLEAVFNGSQFKLLFYGTGWALTALLALNRVLEFFDARKNPRHTSDEDTEA